MVITDTMKTAVRIGAFGIFSVVVVVYLNSLRNQNLELRNDLARADTSRQITKDAVARLAVSVQTLHSENTSLRDGINKVGGRLVFLIDTIRVMGTTQTAPATPARRNGVTFDWGPRDLKFGTLTGVIDTRDSLPTFAPTFVPRPLSIGFAIVQHNDKPWEAVISVEPYGHTEIRTIPQVSTRLTDPAMAKCGILLIPLCDGQVRGSGGLMATSDRSGPIIGVDGSISVFSRRVRLSAQVDSWPSGRLLVGYSLR